jgi:hypothetical protein
MLLELKIQAAKRRVKSLILTASQGESAMSAMNSAQADERAKPTV